MKLKNIELVAQPGGGRFVSEVVAVDLDALSPDARAMAEQVWTTDRRDDLSHVRIETLQTDPQTLPLAGSDVSRGRGGRERRGVLRAVRRRGALARVPPCHSGGDQGGRVTIHRMKPIEIVALIDLLENAGSRARAAATHVDQDDLASAALAIAEAEERLALARARVEALRAT